MSVTVTGAITHTTVVTGANDGTKQVSKDAWNEEHSLSLAIIGLGDAAEKNTGTATGTVAAGDHLHTGVYEPAGVSAADITDSTATGRAVLTAADAPAARTAIGAGTSSFSGAYADLSGKPTLGSLADQDTITASEISDSTATGRAVVAAADAAAARAAIGAGTSSFDGAYASLSGKPTLGSLADQDNITATEISDSTATGRAVITAASQAAARTAIGAGTSSFDGAYGSLSGTPTTFAPSAHATNHKSGGTDSIKLDELAAPTDVTTLNASTSTHGLLRKLDGLTTTFLRGDGTWATPPDTGITQLTGDVTALGAGAQAATIPANTVTYAKMQDVSATSRFIGRITSGSGDPEELTGTQATTLLDAFTSLLKGLVPASGGGTTTFLRADGTFAAPTATAADPSYSPGSFTVATETGRLIIKSMKLTTTQRVTLEGTGRLAVGF